MKKRGISNSRGFVRGECAFWGVLGVDAFDDPQRLVLSFHGRRSMARENVIRLLVTATDERPAFVT
jgi:hypothetical protein